MSDSISQVISVLENDTILFVMGDHGSTLDGNHGGASGLWYSEWGQCWYNMIEEEVNAALFVYSPSVINTKPDHSSFKTGMCTIEMLLMEEQLDK